MRALLPMLLLVAGCVAEQDEVRSAWLRSALASQHRQLLMRAPGLVAEKYAAMARHPYDYFRGTLPLWVEDTTRPGGEGLAPTRFAPQRLRRMLLIGDPHPENVGTFLPLDPTLDPSARGSAQRDEVHVDWNDFDAATFGPPIHDLRRLATGLRLLTAPTLPPDSPVLDQAVLSLARGYLEALSGAQAPPRGAILEELIQRAFEDRLETPRSTGPEYIEATEGERRFVLAALASWRETCLGACPEPRVKHIVRRLGVGVASLPLLRLQVALEGRSAEPEDDLYLDLKEAREAPALPLPAATLPFPARHNAERVVFAQRLLQVDPRLDALLGTAQLDDLTSLKVAERASSLKGLARERITARLSAGEWTGADLEDLGHSLGQLLGGAHARAPVGPDRDELARDALAAFVAGEPTLGVELGAELVAWSSLMARRVEADHLLFVDLLAEFGPHLEAYP